MDKNEQLAENVAGFTAAATQEPEFSPALTCCDPDSDPDPDPLASSQLG